MYKTRFVFQLSPDDSGRVLPLINEVAEQCGPLPTAVNLSTQDDANLITVTATYLTSTSLESNRVISAWNKVAKNVQVERQHILNAESFEAVALSGNEGKKLRKHIAQEVRFLCLRGVGSSGILDYLQECEAVATELKEFVQSTRAPV